MLMATSRATMEQVRGLQTHLGAGLWAPEPAERLGSGFVEENRNIRRNQHGLRAAGPAEVGDEARGAPQQHKHPQQAAHGSASAQATPPGAGCEAGLGGLPGHRGGPQKCQKPPQNQPRALQPHSKPSLRAKTPQGGSPRPPPPPPQPPPSSSSSSSSSPPGPAHPGPPAASRIDPEGARR